jgi:hypothetical protein
VPKDYPKNQMIDLLYAHVFDFLPNLWKLIKVFGNEYNCAFFCNPKTLKFQGSSTITFTKISVLYFKIFVSSYETYVFLFVVKI